MVWPSGFAFDAASAPTLPPAPGRFSTTIGLPSPCDIALATARASTSDEPPAVKVTIIVIGRSGYLAVWACVPPIAAARAKRVITSFESLAVIDRPYSYLFRRPTSFGQKTLPGNDVRCWLLHEKFRLM